MKECIAFSLHASQTRSRATIRWAVNLDRRPRLIDVRQIEPDRGRNISGRCSACGVVLIARLDNRESSNLEALRSKLEKLFARHLTETACGRVKTVRFQKDLSVSLTEPRKLHAAVDIFT
jgi:hypothetical protein